MLLEAETNAEIDENDNNECVVSITSEYDETQQHKQTTSHSFEASVESNFDPQKHCRYCFSVVESTQNTSACLCNGLLCIDCLKQELKLTLTRQTGQMCCTVCKYKYKVTRERLDVERSCCSLMSYGFTKTFPGKHRDLSIFYEYDSAVIFLPIGAARAVSYVTMGWVVFTMLIELISGPEIGEGRMLIMFLDIYLMLEILRITPHIDFPERFKILCTHFCRLVLMFVWGFTAYSQSKMPAQIHTTGSRFNWRWLLFYGVVSLFFDTIDIPCFVRDLKRRAIRDNERQMRIVITCTDGKQIGPMTMPTRDMSISGRNDNFVYQ